MCVCICRTQWKALGPVTEVFAFDFYEAEANMQAAEVSVRLTAHSEGTCNAIAFWFSLHMDEETELHTGPYEDKVACCICAPHDRTEATCI